MNRFPFPQSSIPPALSRMLISARNLDRNTKHAYSRSFWSCQLRGEVSLTRNTTVSNAI